MYDTAEMPNTPKPVLSGCRVLVVDDREDMRSLLTDLLARHDATVLDSASAEEAVACLAAAARRADVVVTDFSLLGARHDGAWLLARIRATWGHGVAVVVVTGHVDRERELSRLGFDGIAFKPLQATELVALVAGIWEARRRTRS
jgi:two-component system response regulator PilR (NtrC family)